jgi:polyisoprenoid-binding protein YceI
MSIATQTLPTGTYGLDRTHSTVEFAVLYIAGTFRGEFSPFDAELTVDEDGTARLTGSTRAAAVRVKDENLELHLQSPDFFDAERTPDLRFESTSIEREGDRIVVAGTLTIRGRPRAVELTGTVSDDVTDAWGNERVGLALAGSIDRTAFGITWNNPLPNGKPSLADAVALSAELQFVKQEPEA